MPERDGMVRPGSSVERITRPIGRLVAATRQQGRFEHLVGKHLLRVSHAPEAEARLRELRPAAVVVTNPFGSLEGTTAAVALRLGIPVFAMIPSWDNISTKRRMEIPYDGYLLWSERQAAELREFYPNRSSAPVRRTGAVQFDVFFQDRFTEPRAAWCARHGLPPERPVIVYAVGSPNFLDEVPGAVAFAERVAAGELGDVTLLVRPHPIHDEGELEHHLAGTGERVVVQRTARPGEKRHQRTQSADAVLDWVSTFRHADVVVNLSSTVTVDAAICDTPVVSLDYDPSPGAPHQVLIREINRTWTHFAPVARSGGVWMAADPDELGEAVRTYLATPELHREGRRAIVTDVCGPADGRSGHRLAEAIRELAG